MFTVVGYVCFFVYTIALVFIGLFCLMQLHLLVIFIFYKKKYAQDYKPDLIENFPVVTVQLPIYNEKYVVERLIDSIVNFNYPKENLEIQVLDDSTDETRDIIIKKVDDLITQGIDIKVVYREDRVGFKAGALKEGLLTAKGELIAIFDADFIPNPDFLLKTVPYFKKSDVGVVQTRWGHINQNFSLLTELQAFQLNAHFTIEQAGRAYGNYFLQFNGTAGIWRKDTIIDAGGWQADTLTEDLDLSIRSQLEGWKIHYLVETVSPAELPVEMNGLRSQQYRWMKGGAENAKKLIKKLWKSDLNNLKKIHSTFHLLSSSVFIFIFLLGIVSIPMLFTIDHIRLNTSFFGYFLSSLISIIAVYFVANVLIAWPKKHFVLRILKFLTLFPIFLSLSMGLSLHNTIAVISGWKGRQSDFIRTPKYGISKNNDSFAGKKYFKSDLSPIVWLEGFFAILFLVAIIYGFVVNKGYFIILHSCLALGFAIIFWYSILHSLRGRA